MNFRWNLLGLVFLFGILLTGCTIVAITSPQAESASGGGDTYYVSPNGSDSGPGTFTSPWKSPAYGTKRLKPGDTLIILGGTYILKDYEKDIIRPPSGTQNAWVTIKGEDGNRPSLKMGGNLLTAIDLSSKSYVKIENLEITNYNGELARDGIEILNSEAKHIVLKNLYIHHLDEFGIDISDVYDIEIDGCTISYCGFGAIGGPSGTSGGWRNARIKNCILSYSGHYYQGSSGPGPYDRPDGFGIEPSEGPIEILGTKVEHNRGDGLDSKAENTYIHECIVSNNFADGIKLWGGGSKIVNSIIYGRGDGDTTSTPWACVVIDTEKAGGNFEIINTTIDDYVGQNYLIYVQYDHPSVNISLNIMNTIFSARGPRSFVYVAGGVNLALSHNLFWMPQGDRVLEYGAQTYTASTITTFGTGNLYGDPLFVRPAFGTEGDYHLQDGSPGIDSGEASGAPSLDISGTSRPQGGGVDIGAYER